MRNRAIDFIKLVALVCMVLSHSRFIFPEYSFNLIVVGRWVFILFAFVFAYNLSKISLSDLSRLRPYFVYLIIFALLSEGPHQLLGSTDNSLHFGPYFPPQHNVLYTYFFALLAVLVFSLSDKPFLRFSVTASYLMIISFFSRQLEYGLAGVTLIVAFYAYLSCTSKFKYFYLMLALCCSIFATSQYYSYLDPILLLSIFLAFCFVVLFSRLNFDFYVPKMGRWLYYFYPIHMGVIYMIAS